MENIINERLVEIILKYKSIQEYLFNIVILNTVSIILNTLFGFPFCIDNAVLDM